MTPRPPFEPKPVPPTGTQDTVAFVARTPEHGEDTNCRLEPIQLFTYPPSAMAEWLSITARLLGIGAITGLAKVLDLTAVQVSDLRRGSASLTNDEWKEVAHRLAAHHVEQLSPDTTNLPLTEEQRQLTLLALARLSLTHQGFDESLNAIALRIDNEHAGRATTYDGFRKTAPWVAPVVTITTNETSEFDELTALKKLDAEPPPNAFRFDLTHTDPQPNRILNAHRIYLQTYRDHLAEQSRSFATTGANADHQAAHLAADKAFNTAMLKASLEAATATPTHPKPSVSTR